MTTHTAKVPRHWQTFLANENNKTELFSFLSTALVTNGSIPEDKDVFITADDCVHHVLFIQGEAIQANVDHALV